MAYNRKTKKQGYEEMHTVGEWRMIETLRNRIPVEIPSLGLRLEPDGSVTHLDDKVKKEYIAI